MSQRALIIDEPWIGHILAGRKIWEMRTTATRIRGDVALIRKGSGKIVAVAELTGTDGPFDKTQMVCTVDKHQIPSAMIESGMVDKWRYAWQLENVRRLDNPVAYEHPSGAVIWVNLAPSVWEQICAELGSTPRLSASTSFKRGR